MSSSMIVLLVLFILLIAALLLFYYLLCRSQPLHRSTAAFPLQHSHSRRRQVFLATFSASLLLLPRFTFSDVTRSGSVTILGECAIFLAEFEPDHQLCLIPSRLHTFHVDCIDTWLASQSCICPVCRGEIFRSDSDIYRTAAAFVGTTVPIDEEYKKIAVVINSLTPLSTMQFVES